MYSYTRTDILGNNSRRFVDMTTKRTGSVAVDGTWMYSISGAKVTFTNCVYMRGPVTAVAAPPAYTVSGEDGDVFLSAKINTETGACEIIEAATLALATDAAIPTDEFVKVPLLKLTKKTAGGAVSLRVALRYIECIPEIPMPPDGLSLEPNADGRPQICGWDGEDNVTASGISECLLADPDTGKITAAGSADTYELLVRVGGAGGPVGYMPIGEGDGSDPEDPNAEKCDQNQHPASGGGGGGDEGEDHPADEDNEHPGEDDNGTGGDTGDAQHPASDDCYTTAY